MEASLEKRMLMLARELAVSHGTLFAATLLAEANVPLKRALIALARQRGAGNFDEMGPVEGSSVERLRAFPLNKGR